MQGKRRERDHANDSGRSLGARRAQSSRAPDFAGAVDGHLGYSEKQHLLSVAFTERAPRVRIISARAATRRERQLHEQNVKKAAQEPS